VFRNTLLLFVVSLCVACTTSQRELPLYAAEVEVYLEPYDDRGRCRLHIALRNISGARQGFSSFRISWEVDGANLPDTELRHNAMRVGMLRSASASLPLPCDQVEQMRIESALWELFEGWDNENPQKVRIGGADATDWNFAYSDDLKVWVGTRTTG